jgi:prepilin-type N-terminal cleavage/methylation domain-containing protein
MLVIRKIFILSRPKNPALKGRDELWPLKYFAKETFGFSPRSFIQKSKKSNKPLLSGFTLVEMVAVIVILGIVAAIGVPLILSAADALSFLTVRVDMAQSADVAMGRITQEIRRLRDAESIDTATSTQFRFFDADDTDIDYSLSGSNLMRNSDILASNVDSLTFTYYDSSGGVLSPPEFGIGTTTDIRRVEILISLENGAYQFNYQSQVRPRNLE